MKGESSPRIPAKRAATAFPILDILAERWSPLAFSDRRVADDDLRSLFEAARWAPSANNEQPWRFLIATRDQADEFARLLSCLTDGNKLWAHAVPVLCLNLVSTRYTRNGKENRTAAHDLGLAMGNLLAEATSRGLHVHQMGGILPDRVTELYELPADVAPWTAMAIGYAGDPSALPEKLLERELAVRTRKPLVDVVYSGAWARPATFLTSIDVTKP